LVALGINGIVAAWERSITPFIGAFVTFCAIIIVGIWSFFIVPYFSKTKKSDGPAKLAKKKEDYEEVNDDEIGIASSSFWSAEQGTSVSLWWWLGARPHFASPWLLDFLSAVRNF